jgi:Zn-dependent metalloprotease
MLDLKKFSIRWNRDVYVPRKISGYLTGPATGSPRRIAEGFLKENHRTLKISAPLEDLRFDKVSESLAASTVLFQQYFKGTPIHGAWVSIHLDRERRIFMVKNDTVPVEKLTKRIGKLKTVMLPAAKIDAMIRKKIRDLGALGTPVTKERMIYPLRGMLRPVWKVKFGTKQPVASWILFLDAATGTVIDERNVLRKVSGRGMVFIPNPVVALDNDELGDEADKDQPALRKAYRTVELRDLAGSGYLTGPYVDTSRTKKRVRSTSNEFLLTRGDNGFGEVMTYYHIDALQRHIQSLGFVGSKTILAQPIKVNVNGTREDNSYYDPSPGRHDLTFGSGGVDDAEDAEIIAHEYGHAVQDAIISGFGQHIEGRSMGEGFGDYLAGSFYAKYKKAARRVKLGEWDAKGYNQECLRRLDSAKHYPEDMEGEEHSDGEIWSACLWNVRKVLGAKKTDTVILESHFYLSQYSDFKDGAEAIIMAEQTLYGGKKKKGLTKVFRDAGILM